MTFCSFTSVIVLSTLSLLATSFVIPSAEKHVGRHIPIQNRGEIHLKERRTKHTLFESTETNVDAEPKNRENRPVFSASKESLRPLSTTQRRLEDLGKLLQEPANTKKLVALDRASILELGKYGFIFGLTMWRFSLGRALLGTYDTMGNSAKMLSLISTISAQFLTVGGLYATVLTSQLRWAAGIWESARDTKRKQAFRRLKKATTDPSRPRILPEGVSEVPLSAHLRAFLSDVEYRNEQDSKKLFNRKVKETVTGHKLFRLLCALFFASFLQLTAVAFSNTLFSRKICADRFERDIASYTDWIASTGRHTGMFWWKKPVGDPLLVSMPSHPLTRHCIGPLLWRFFIFPRGVVRRLGKFYARNPWLVYCHESVESWSGVAMFVTAGAMLLRDFLGLADALVQAKRVLDGESPIATGNEAV